MSGFGPPSTSQKFMLTQDNYRRMTTYILASSGIGIYSLGFRTLRSSEYAVTVIRKSLLLLLLLLLLLFTALELSPGGSGYFTCIQNTKLVTTKFKSGGQHEKHVLATWNFGNHLNICF